MEYDKLEPFGEVRADIRMGIIAATIANVNRGQGTPPFSAHDFMPKFWEEIQEKTPEEMREDLERLARSLGARDLRRSPQLVDSKGQPIFSKRDLSAGTIQRTLRARGETGPGTDSRTVSRSVVVTKPVEVVDLRPDRTAAKPIVYPPEMGKN